MVLFGGLEFVVGGYVIHKYHKNKTEKRKAEEEWNQRRQNAHLGPRPQHQQQQRPVLQLPPQKYACYAPQPQAQPPFPPRPHTAQTFPQMGPYPPQPQPVPQFQPQMQPLRRADSFATISNMPIANGFNGPPPQNAMPLLPPRPQQPMNTQYLLPVPHNQPGNSPYNNPGFSVSSPSFSQSSNGPVYHNAHQAFGRNTIDDELEYEPHSPFLPPSPHSPHSQYTASTQLGEEERDPPPPYRP